MYSKGQFGYVILLFIALSLIAYQQNSPMETPIPIQDTALRSQVEPTSTTDVRATDIRATDVRTVADVLATTVQQPVVAVNQTVTAQALQIQTAFIQVGLAPPAKVHLVTELATSIPSPPVVRVEVAVARVTPEPATATPTPTYTAQPTEVPVDPPPPTAVLEEEPVPVGRSGLSREEALPAHFASSLFAHNEVRAEIALPPFEWDPTLAQASQEWANVMAAQGVLQHASNLGAVGENISQQVAGTAAHEIVKSALFGWASDREREYYASTNGCPYTSEQFGYCGHYKAIISTQFTKVGCGVTSAGDWDFWVCRFLEG